ncbi:MAG: hypothetical protein JW915_17590 [Chitinispirillaceae bacterium]|nr:hypothetical protein [Chitinispirillaceae bacterium]
MSTVNANFSINNIPQLDRYHNETLKAPAVEQVQKEQINLNETMMNLKRPNEIKNSNLVENSKKKIQNVSKKKGRKKNNPESKKREKKQDASGENGFFIDVEC